jgi:FkbM family methyltransferase
MTNIIKFDNFYIEFFRNDCLAENSIAKNKNWEPHITKFVKNLHSKINIKNIIDIGANIGYHTMLFSRIIGNNGVIYAFEPQPQIFSLLSNNISNNNLKNVILYNNACSDEETIVYLPKFNIPLQNIENMGDITPNYNVNINDKYAIQSVIIDRLNLSKIDFIKIDIQGWEVKAIIGLKELLERDKPYMIVEFEYFQLAKDNKTCSELADLLRTYGYYIYYLDYEYPSDHVCVHHTKLKEFNEYFKDNIFDHNEPNNVNNNIAFGITKKIKLNY